MITGLIGSGDPSPIRLPGRAPVVLAFHGFGGTPREVELVTQAAAELGLAARAPLLPGHGTSVADLARSGWTDWLEAASAELEEATAGGEPAIVAGLSLGSLIAAHLAALAPERVTGLVMLANAVRLMAPTAWGLELVDRLRVPDFWLPKVTSDIADPAARRDHLTYGAQPAHAAVSVLRAGALVASELDRVRCPAFIAHGARDRVCPVQNALWVQSRLGSRQAELLLLPRSRHIITRDLERRELFGRLREFLRTITAEDLC
jgi:carboxylesterase